MKDVKTLLILALGVVIIFLLTCNGNTKPIKTITIKTVRVDSLRVVDTLERLIYVPIKEVPFIKEVPLIEEVKGIDLSDTNDFKEGLRTFHYGASDSLLKYNIYVKSEYKPLSVKMDYDLKQFTIQDSIYIRDSTHVKEVVKKGFVSVGATVLGSRNSFGFAPLLIYSQKNGNNYGIGYDVLNNNLHLQFTKKIAFR